MKKILIWSIFAAIFLLPGFIWWPLSGPSALGLDYAGPPGQSAYLYAKLVGMYALLIFWLQGLYGMTRGTFGHEVIVSWSVKKHRFIGLTAMLAVLVHFFLFFTAVMQRTDHIPLHLLMPLPRNSYSAALMTGWLALVGGCVVVIAGLTRNLFKRYWIYLHRVSVPALVLAFIHALLIGSEAKSTALTVLYVLCFAVTIVVFALRIKKQVDMKVAVRESIEL